MRRNLKALNLLQEKYREKVKCIYIDPPYNANSSEIIYKNTYKNSSWLTLISNRLAISRAFLSDKFVYVTAIDEVEQEVLGRLFSEMFIDYEKNCITIVHNPTGQQGVNFSYTHEFAYFIFPSAGQSIGLENREDNPDIRPLRNVSQGAHLRTDAANCFYPIYVKDKIIVGFGDVCPDEFHPKGINVIRKDGVIEVYPIDPQGVERKWVFARNTVESILDELEAQYDQKKKQWDIIRTKRRFNYKSVWTGSKYSANSYGSRILNEILGSNVFTFPKSIFTVRDCIDAALCNENRGLVLDYFGGSGTTAHAVINLNRSDGGKRKYILVEMGEYFDTVLKPRIQKVVYSKDCTVDLVETFNYLIGLYVEQTETIRGFKVVRGKLRTGEKSLVIWRKTKEKANKDLDEFFKKQKYNTQDFEFDLIFVNGDNTLENLKVAKDKWNVRLIEEEFKKRMFETVGA